MALFRGGTQTKFLRTGACAEPWKNPFNRAGFERRPCTSCIRNYTKQSVRSTILLSLQRKTITVIVDTKQIEAVELNLFIHKKKIKLVNVSCQRKRARRNTNVRQILLRKICVIYLPIKLGKQVLCWAFSPFSAFSLYI